MISVPPNCVMNPEHGAYMDWLVEHANSLASKLGQEAAGLTRFTLTEQQREADIRMVTRALNTASHRR